MTEGTCTRCDSTRGRARIRVANVDPLQRDLQNKSVESSIGDKQVAAAAEDKQRRSLFAGPGSSTGDVRFAVSRRKPPRRAANAKRRERSEQLVFLNAHRSKSKSESKPVSI